MEGDKSILLNVQFSNKKRGPPFRDIIVVENGKLYFIQLNELLIQFLYLAVDEKVFDGQ